MKVQKIKHVPMRTCIQTREKLPKNELLHFVYLKDKGEFIFDPKGKARGRGANLKNDLDIFDMAVKVKAFNRAFKTNISSENINMVRKTVKKFLTRQNLSKDGKKISIRVKVDEKVKLR